LVELDESEAVVSAVCGGKGDGLRVVAEPFEQVVLA